ncbi:PREDICTED: uncharacterized protein LOC109218017 [Nicotiana attenuata]|uniref:uncharacterized protein LOC109218017 n=1 Tax=Nicotiana attenuata TaxID=49451 RepID=UPI000905A20D|nr:PREDICTED: uncharacterized protein LOC109218017 [Nicotiana attenuata]
MKIDLKKAYDMVRWEFVEEALLGYGYPPKFVQLIMECISSPKFSVKVNGVGHGYFEGKRDLRFHHMCKKLKLTHLIFTDDLMIFCKDQLSSFKKVMEAHSATTRLIANLEKSSLFMAGVDAATSTSLLEYTGFSLAEYPIKYLGLPFSYKKYNSSRSQGEERVRKEEFVAGEIFVLRVREGGPAYAKHWGSWPTRSRCRSRVRAERMVDWVPDPYAYAFT